MFLGNAKPGEYKQVLNYVSKAEHSIISGDATFPVKIKVACGLAHLAEGRFSKAAEQLTSIRPPDDDTSMGGSFCSAEDVAMYGALCGLASLQRDQLLKLLETPGFLDLVPPLRDAVQVYCRADYPGCIRILQSLCYIFELDMLLSPHLEKLSNAILHKCCMEYLKPYRKVHLPKMAETFSLPLDQLVTILSDLIGTGKILYARIDCRSQTLERRKELEIRERKIATKRKIMKMEQAILNDAYGMMIRSACTENDQMVDRRKQNVSEMYSSDEDGPDVPMEVGNPEDVY